MTQCAAETLRTLNGAVVINPLSLLNALSRRLKKERPLSPSNSLRATIMEHEEGHHVIRCATSVELPLDTYQRPFPTYASGPRRSPRKTLPTLTRSRCRR